MEPKHRFMSAYEQRIEPPDKAWQYLLVAAEPYETIGFKVGFDFDFFFPLTYLQGNPFSYILSSLFNSTFKWEIFVDLDRF